MVIYILKRLGLALITLLIVSIIIFAAAEVLPGDLGRSILGPFASRDQVEALNREYGVDDPLPVRYWDWATSYVTGDWGTSPIQQVEVRPLVLDRLGNSLILGAFAFVVVVPISIALGVLAALHYGRTLDRVISIAGLSFIALPEFVVGVVVIVIFAVQLGWFPVSSQVPGTNPVDIVEQLLLPSIPLMFVLFGYIARMARAGTVEALDADYTRTAIIKGLPQRAVVRRHVLRNSLLPTIAVVATQAGYLLGGLLVIETIFNYQGIGQALWRAAVQKDFPLLQSGVLIVGVVYLVATLLADIAYSVLNPRVRLGGEQ